MHVIQGLAVALDTDDAEKVLELTGQALTLLRRYAPERYSELMKIVSIVAITKKQVNVQYLHGPAAILFSRTRLMELSPTELASLLVHECCHGRLWMKGIPFRAWAKPRIEAACVRAELGLLRRLPDDDGLTQYKSAMYDRLAAG